MKIGVDPHWRLRTRVYKQLRAWHAYDGKFYSGPLLLKRLCGRVHHFGPSNSMTEDEITICKNLIGPHGYAYYKMLEARNK